MGVQSPMANESPKGQNSDPFQVGGHMEAGGEWYTVKGYGSSMLLS